jgi:hypothetical protein
VVRIGALIPVGLVASACGSPTAPTATPAVHVTVPAGWKTYSYAGSTISVPADWAVATSEGCTVGSGQGLLVLGAPKVLRNCPVGVDSVVIASLSPGDRAATAACPSTTINGLTTYVLPCRADDGTNIVQYLVPSLAIEAVGSGTAGENVSGSGTNTVVGQVLHTLR